GERLIEEGLAVHLSSLAYPERSLAQHLFVSEARLSTLREYRDSLLQAASDKLHETDEPAVQRFLFAPPTDPDSPPRPGGYVGYALLSEYLRKHPDETQAVFERPARELLE
ncbi:MAG: hypothetical protein GTO55_03185, partial [Armatimonadetes bacterium]|nr:hypothetical protein [Armatimonadota bacterium]NIM23278.1 hypothetical protein [Armatimonadota bacterium]NIM67146.1 hypothetical protein [Armatimonadota bacterium]NIM75672.1 hypothetical protein [Armatimonadota bacterium]NIN05335.1 hypothetical protein [Armatimonadota bacterium]